MKLEEYVDLMFDQKTSTYVGVIPDVKGNISVNISGEIKISSDGKKLLFYNTFSLGMTNVSLSCTLIADLKNDERNKVIMDIETLVSYMYFGAENTAKKPIGEKE